MKRLSLNHLLIKIRKAFIVFAFLTLASSPIVLYYNHSLKGIITDIIHDKIYQNHLILNRIVVDGIHLLTKQEIIAHLEYLYGMPLYSLDIKKIHEQILANPWVEQASVTRFCPNRIIINITEKKPYAIWEDAKGKMLICDEEGMPIADEIDRVADLDLPIIITSAPSFVCNPVTAFIKKDLDFSSKVKSIENINGRRWDIILKNGIKIKLPQKKLDKIFEFLFANQEKIFSSNAAVIDMRLPDKIYVQETT